MNSQIKTSGLQVGTFEIPLKKNGYFLMSEETYQEYLTGVNATKFKNFISQMGVEIINCSIGKKLILFS